VGNSYITNIDPGQEGSVRNGLAGSVHQPVYISSRGVQSIKTSRVLKGTVDHGGTDSGNGEVGLALLNEVPGGLLGERLGGTVGGGSALNLNSLIVGNGVPVGLGVGVSGAETLGKVDHGGEGGGNNDTLDGGVVGNDGLEDTDGSLDGGVEEVLAVVLLVVESEGGSGVDNL
jgi:hypothetical protein